MNLKSDKAFIFSCIVLAIMAIIIISVWSVSNANNENARLIYVAAGILVGLGLIFILAMGMYYWDKEPTPGQTTQPGKDIFKSCVKIIPPIAMLVIGYYFGASSHNLASDQPNKQATDNKAKTPATQTKAK